MTMFDQFQNLLSSIKPVDMSLTPAVQARLDDLTKPRGSLGRLEEIVMKYAVATGTPDPVLKRKKVFCFAADHGVASEGVSAFPAEVTPQMVYNMLGGGAAINVLSRHAGADLEVVDMGVNHDFGEQPMLRVRKVRHGSSNIVEGPAMTLDECLQAVMTGAEIAAESPKSETSKVTDGFIPEMTAAKACPAGGESRQAAAAAVLMAMPAHPGRE